jgi:hypothetical protein
MDLWIILSMFLVVGLAGFFILRSIAKLGKTSCITATKTNGYLCQCRNGISRQTCTSQSGIFQAQSCQSIPDWNNQCKTKLIGSCITSTGCQYPALESECKAVSGLWNVGSECSTQSAGPSVLDTAFT